MSRGDGCEFTGSTKRAAMYLAENKCQVCGSTEDLQVHHIIGIWYAIKYYPFLLHTLVKSLDNAIVLCPKDHAIADLEMENTFRESAARIFGL